MYPDNDDDDLSGLDRGDDLDQHDNDDTSKVDDKSADNADDADDSKDDGKDDDRARDEQGRFKKSDDKAKGDDKSDDKAKDDDKSDEDEDGEDEDEDEDEEGEDAKKQNLPIRLNKAKEQRDRAREDAARERAERERLQRELDKLRDDGKKDKEDPVAKLNAELDSLYEKVEEARADGDTKGAAQLQRQIDAKNREIVKLEAEHIASETSSKAAEDARYDALLERLEGDIDALNPQHDDFDPKAVKALEFYTEAHEKMGMAASKALMQAARVVFGYGTDKKDNAKDDAKGDDKDDKKDDKVVQMRKKTDAKKAADTQRKQPPDLANRGVNKDDTKIDVGGLSDEEWDNLPESKRAQMRGDNM